MKQLKYATIRDIIYLPRSYLKLYVRRRPRLAPAKNLIAFTSRWLRPISMRTDLDLTRLRDEELREELFTSRYKCVLSFSIL